MTRDGLPKLPLAADGSPLISPYHPQLRPSDSRTNHSEEGEDHQISGD